MDLDNLIIEATPRMHEGELKKVLEKLPISITGTRGFKIRVYAGLRQFIYLEETVGQVTHINLGSCLFIPRGIEDIGDGVVNKNTSMTFQYGRRKYCFSYNVDTK